MASRSSLAARTPERHVFGSLKNVHLLRLLGNIFRKFFVYFSKILSYKAQNIYFQYIVQVWKWSGLKNMIYVWLVKFEQVISLSLRRKKTVQRAQVWQRIADTLCSYDTPKFTVSKRAVGDRYGIISSKYRKTLSAEKRASGIEVEQTELEVLLEELIEQEDLSEEEGNETKRKTEQDKSKAQEIRKTAMENLGETKQKKLVNGEQDDATSLPLKNKTRKSGSKVVGYLKEKSEQEAKLREQEIEIKKTQQEMEGKRYDSLMTMMAQQQQQQQQIQASMVEQNKLMLSLLSKLLNN